MWILLLVSVFSFGETTSLEIAQFKTEEECATVSFLLTKTSESIWAQTAKTVTVQYICQEIPHE